MKAKILNGYVPAICGKDRWTHGYKYRTSDGTLHTHQTGYIADGDVISNYWRGRVFKPCITKPRPQAVKSLGEIARDAFGVAIIGLDAANGAEIKQGHFDQAARAVAKAVRRRASR